MYKKSVLNNGLRVITHQMPHMQSVALGVWINAGSRFETQSNNGIAHFLEHLLFKGSRRYSCRKIKESIEGVGGALNGFTSEELCCYFVKLPAKYLNLALDILSDMILNPLLLEKDVKKEKNVIIEEIKMYRDLPQTYVQELVEELLWPKQPLGMNILGTIKSVSELSAQDLFSFKEKYYLTPEIVIAACGRLERDQILRAAKKIFKAYRPKKKNKFRKAIIQQDQAQLKVSFKNTEQTHFSLGFHGLERNSPKRFALGFLHVILGANMSSRLFNEVREKRGLAYRINSQVKFLADTGSFLVNAGIEHKKVEAALEVVIKELEKLKQDLVSPYEFKRAKEFYIGQLSISLEDTLEHMLWIGESLSSLDKTYSLDEIIEEVNQVTREDLRGLSRTMFKEKKRNLALIGPSQDKKDKLDECLRRK